MRIRTQLFALIGSFAVVFGGFVVLSWESQAERAEDSVYRPVLETKDLIADVLPPPAFVLEAHALVLDLATNRDANAREAAVAHWRTLEKAFRERRELWLKALEAGELKTAVEKAGREAEQYFAAADQAYLPALAAGDQAKAAEVLRAELKPLFALHRASIDRVVALAEERTKRQESQAAGAVRATKTTLVGVGSAAIALSLFFGWLLSSRIVRRMGELGAALSRVAEGDYTVEVAVSAHDELGELEESLNATVQTGRAMLTQLRQSSAEVGSASMRLAESTAEVAEGAQRQADLVSRTVTDLDGLSSRVRENSSQASEASTSAQQTQNHARSGADVMLKSRESMAAISEASRKVQQIISVIDEFAFQTNIVALNAAVEAARAGEAGRGFAVVANEVRTLAQRSAESAREVRSLVTDTIAKVKAGEALAKDSEEAFQQIGLATAHLTQLVDAMTRSFQGQVDAIGSVTRELSTISTVTQRNAAESEQLSGMSEVLKTQSHQLDALTRRFVVDVGELRTSAPDKPTASEPSFEEPRVQPRRHAEVRPRAN